MAEQTQDPRSPASFDPDESPFELPPIEGIPFKKGSEEDLAIKEIIREADETRAKQAPSDH